MRHKVAVVTVTYGNRAAYLARVIQAVIEQSVAWCVDRVIICDNGASPQTKELIGRLSSADERMQVEDLGRNMGSAAGYARGITRAVESGAELVWCLDDDNMPEADALERLLQAYDSLPKPVVVLALRPSRQEYVRRAAGLPLEHCFPRAASFNGFSLVDLPGRIALALGLRRPRADQRPGLNTNHQPMTVPYAPYGGFLFSSDLVKRVGLPRSDYYLYADDYEFSRRFPQMGCPIYLVPTSVIHDLEVSWNRKQDSTPLWFRGPLTANGRDFETRLYYAIRNRTHLECYGFGWCGRWVYWVNLSAFLLLLAVQLLLLTGRGSKTAWPLFRSFVKGTYDGLRGNLGRPTE